MSAQFPSAHHGPTTAEKLRRLPWSVAANTVHMIFYQLTFTSTLFVLFLNEFGLRKSQIGILLSLFSFASLLALPAAPHLARFGNKRSFMLFFGSRYAVPALVIPVPWMVARFGFQVTFGYIVAVVALFSVLGALGNTAAYSWIQEYVPNAVRGKYTAITSIFTTLTGLVAAAGASYVIERSTGLNGFLSLFGVGVIFGLIALYMFGFVPGGAPVVQEAVPGRTLNKVLEVTRDGNFMRFMIGVGIVHFATLPLISFVPLYLHEKVGLTTANVALLQAGVLLGGLASSYLWGWAADRYGSKPVMVSGLAIAMALPICWLLIPRGSATSFLIALGIIFLQGVFDMSWSIGSNRLLYVSMVPPEKKTAYMSLYFAWYGLIGGIGQLLGGQVLEHAQGIQGQFLFLTLDAYTTVFLISLFLIIGAGLLLGSVREDAVVSVRQFAGLFLRGNPFMAVESLIRYHWAKDERATISATERLGQTQSPLTVDELLEALADPRFEVRFEAIVSISRRTPDPRLSAALARILHSKQPSLGVVAAWALGRIGDTRATEALQVGLDSSYRSIRDHAARALASLGDLASAPLLLERLAREPDEGLQVAYASALGKLGVQEAVLPLLGMLRESQDEETRIVLALALARIVGQEHHFIHFWRETRSEAGTAAAQAVAAVRRAVGRHHPDERALLLLLDGCAEALAQGDLSRGMAQLGGVLHQQPTARFSPTALAMLHACAGQLETTGATRFEYTLLTLHVLTVGWRSPG